MQIFEIKLIILYFLKIKNIYRIYDDDVFMSFLNVESICVPCCNNIC